MENNRLKISVINKDVLYSVIESLKNIRPVDYDGMNRLVGCVIVLENALNDPFAQDVEDIVNQRIHDNEPDGEKESKGEGI